MKVRGSHLFGWLAMAANAPTGKRFSHRLRLVGWTRRDYLTLGQACAGGILILGRTGSGKSTLASFILRSLVRAGIPGISLSAKVSSAGETRDMIEAEGQKAVIFDVDTGHHFAFLNWFLENSRKGMFIDNLVNLLFQVAEIASRDSGQPGRQDEFFQSSLMMLLRYLLCIQIKTTGKVDVLELLKTAQTLPQTLEQASRKDSETVKLINDALKSNPDSQEVKLAHAYLLTSWPLLAEKTRSCIQQSLEVLLGSFVTEPLHSLFFAHATSTVTPTDVTEKRLHLIIGVDVKTHKLAGKVAGCIWKLAQQMWIENRPGLDRPSETVTPCYIFGDEMQNWLVPKPDAEYQATCRSPGRGITIACTQSVEAFYAECGGDPSSRSRVNHLLNNFGTLVGCCSTAENGKWFSDAVGMVIRERRTRQETPPNVAGDAREQISRDLGGTNNSWAETEQYDVPPRRFVGLRTAGDEYAGWGDAIVFAGGARFKASGRRWMKVSFRRKRADRSIWKPNKLFIAV